jgi:tetratricopeptide (TPR) repeat protein
VTVRASLSLPLLLALCVTPGLAAPRKASPPVEDPVELAGLLVREGDWERAAEVLAAIDPAAPGLDRSRLWTLRGLAALQAGRATEASEAFRAALASAVEGRELLELHLARALLAAGDPRGALAALDRAGEVGLSLPGTYLLRAEAQEALGQGEAAWDALEAGARAFPDQAELRRRQVFLLVRLGLFREARALGEVLLARPDSAADDAIAIAEALRRGGDASEAQAILEAALLRQGDDRALLLAAARAALDAGQPRNAGRFLERAAVIDPALALDAAEAYRRAADFEAALRCNAAVQDPAAKARQRLGLLLDAEEWELAVALEERLDRLGLGEDDGVAYGLGYAWFRLGDFDRAEARLGSIADPEVFRRANELRGAMAACDPREGCG